MKIYQYRDFILSFCFFSILHILWKVCCGSKYNGNKKLWFSFSLSTLHALIVAPLSVYLWFNIDGMCFVNEDDNHDRTEFILMKFMIGYLLSDFLWVSLWLSPIETNLHHVVGLLGLGSIIYFKRGGNMGLFFIATEISTVPLNLRWFLMHSGTKGMSLVVINVLFLLCFFSVRIYGIPWFYGCIDQLLHSDGNVIVKMVGISSGTIICCLNIYWFVLMIQKVIAMVSPNKKDAKEYYASPNTVSNKEN